MGALEKNVLTEALRVQNILVPKSAEHIAEIEAPENATIKALKTGTEGDFCSVDSAKFESWGFHSPLMFWNCSGSAVQDDEDVLGTINSQTNRRSYLNLTLRPTSVFAGKSFVKDEVVAADALVLTLFGRRTNSSSENWEQSIHQLYTQSRERGDLLYPNDGHVLHSRLYEFQQKPLSFQDNLFLIIAYLLMALYVIISLGKLRAVKSWAGLFMTVMFEIALSITASFSACGLLKIDLARIPDAAYPFVVLVMGLENMFRLVNAVLAQKPELPTSQRIATALSEVGHLALATAAQMLFVLWILATFAVGIAPFCVFAAIALVFDFVFHLTFFLAVLSVDVRRMELSDLLDRAKNAPPTRKQSNARQERQYWLDALLQGRLPFSSRIAGSAISISFLLALNMHFYESGNSLGSLFYSLRSMFVSHPNHYDTLLHAPAINQARTPAAWLRIQDYRYAQEVLRYVKPTAHSIIARVYDPLLIVLNSSNRSGQPLREEPFFASLWSLFRKHLYPFLLAVIFSVAFVTLLMQYLLWNELPDEDTDGGESKASVLTVENLPKSHRLDVVHLTACGKGHLISVSLDRLITFSLFDQRTHLYSLSSALATAITPPVWPVAALTIDESGHWAALCGPGGKVVFWNMAERRPSHTIHVDLNDERPMLFALMQLETSEDGHLSLLVGTPHGQVRIIDPFKGDPPKLVRISSEKLVLATAIRSRAGHIIVALTKSGKVRIATLAAGEWTTSAVEKFDARLAPLSQEGVVKSVSVAAALNMVAAVRLRVVDLVDTKTKAQIHSFPAILVRGHSLRVLHSTARQCKTCNAAIAVHSFSLAYTDFETQSAVLRTYTLSDDQNDLICLGPRIAGKNYPCRSLSNAKEHIDVVEHPGSWEATNTQSLIGIRLRPSGADTPHSTVSTASGFGGPQFNLQAFDKVKKRNTPDGLSRLSGLLNLDKTAHNANNDTDDWEVWSIFANGDFHAEPLHPASTDERAQSIGEDELLVAAPGPLVRLGQKSVAVGFGNRVKLVMAGTDRFEQDPGDFQDLSVPASARRRKPLNKRAA
jgi:hypothetical protein